MAEMLLINPRRRRRKTTSKTRRRVSHSRRRNPIRARRRNPVASRSVSMPLSRRRRRNPIGRKRRSMFGRRRRNPISLGGLNTNKLLGMFKDAGIGGAGAVVMDVIMGQLNQYLPTTFQTNPTTLGAGDAVKAALTALLGHLGNKATKGLSYKMAQGALAVQAYEVLKGLLPSTMTLGYMSPAAIVKGSNRVGPTQAGRQGFAAYVGHGGRTPLLNGRGVSAYTSGRPLLNGLGRQSPQAREGVSTYR